MILWNKEIRPVCNLCGPGILTNTHTHLFPTPSPHLRGLLKLHQLREHVLQNVFGCPPVPRQLRAHAHHLTTLPDIILQILLCAWGGRRRGRERVAVGGRGGDDCPLSSITSPPGFSASLRHFYLNRYGW